MCSSDLELLESEETGFLHLFVEKAHAQGDDSASTVDELLAEIELYTDLAVEAAEDAADTSPADEVEELLEDIRESQDETLDVLEELSDDIDSDILGEVADTVSESADSVEAALEEVEEVLESGDVNVSDLEIETVVEIGRAHV